VYLIIEIER